MKKIHLILLIVITCIIAFFLLKQQSDLKAVNQRVTRLEKQCKEADNHIASLESIVSVLQTNDYITGVEEILINGKKIGYQISFAQHDPIAIYHGKKGQDGQAGQKGRDGVDGQDGRDGLNGQDGRDGTNIETTVVVTKIDTIVVKVSEPIVSSTTMESEPSVTPTSPSNADNLNSNDNTGAPGRFSRGILP
jgi:hypothetical protein